MIYKDRCGTHYSSEFRCKTPTYPLVVECEIAQVTLSELLQLLVHLLRLDLGALKNHINLVVRYGGVLRSEHLFSTVADHADHIVLAERLLCLRQTSLLDDDVVKTEFHLGTFDDALVDGVLRDETEDAHLEEAECIGDLNWSLTCFF